MFCKNCGNRLDDKAVVCPSCGVAAPSSVNVPNHLVGAILVTIFCCVPFGIAAIVYATSVNTKLAQGDVEGAKKASKIANNWIWASLFGWLIIIALYIVYFVAVAASVASDLA